MKSHLHKTDLILSFDLAAERHIFCNQGITASSTSESGVPSFPPAQE
jgi:hypothetical protein